MSQSLNPITGVSSTVISQYKFMLGVVVYLSINAHHLMLQAFADSYQALPAFGAGDLPLLKAEIVSSIARMSLLALQISAPVMAVGLVVDAALGVVNKAVPQMQAFLVGLPAKVLMGLLDSTRRSALSFAARFGPPMSPP